MNGRVLGIAAQSVGITEAAYREAVAYAQEENNLEVPLCGSLAFEMINGIKQSWTASKPSLRNSKICGYL